tara:strand:- start:3 stop:290 length:288 start_codon:yes stop_codon:yes gene_type:complete
MIQLQDVSKSFKGNIATKNLILKLGKENFKSFLGANGAGKSTTINMWLGFLNPDSGKIYSNDKVTSNNSQDYRNDIQNSIDVSIEKMIFRHLEQC